MHSYEALAILALALSTASPVLSAPVRGSQQQARANVDERGIGTAILKTVGINGALGAGVPVLEHFLGGGHDSDSTRRAMSRDTDLTPADLRVNGLSVGTLDSDNGDDGNTTPGYIFFDGRPVNLDRRAPAGLGNLLDDALDSSDSLGKVVTDNIANGLAAGATAFGVDKLLGNKNKRDEGDDLFPPPTPSGIFDGFVKGLPVITNSQEQPLPAGIPTFVKRAPDDSASAINSPESLVQNLYADISQNRNLPGRTFRRDPSIVGQAVSIASDLTKGAGSKAGSFLRRDDDLVLAREIIDHFHRLKSFGTNLEQTAHKSHKSHFE